MRSGPDRKNKPDRPEEDGEETAVLESDDDYKFPTARGVLTADEIAALLRPTLPQPALDDGSVVPETVAPKQTETFDETPVLEPVSPANQALAARLSTALGKGTGIKAAVNPAQFASIERSALAGLLHGKSSAIACLGVSETDIRALVCLPPDLADAIIAKACGASGSTGRIGDGWTLSAIDCALLEQLLEPVGEAVRPGLKLQSIETDIPYVTSLLPVQHVDVAEFGVEATGIHSDLAVIQGDMNELEERPPESRDNAPVTALATARLASLSVPLSRVTALKAGSTLLLGLPPDQPVELLSGGRDGTPAYEGRMGRKGNKVAIKISKKLRAFKTSS
ncbi:MAG: FliM/FliN family flagellar motor switch protein [Pseudomonadota bacterium]